MSGVTQQCAPHLGQSFHARAEAQRLHKLSGSCVHVNTSGNVFKSRTACFVHNVSGLSFLQKEVVRQCAITLGLLFQQTQHIKVLSFYRDLSSKSLSSLVSHDELSDVGLVT